MGSRAYTVSGIYQWTNDMETNIGMSRRDTKRLNRIHRQSGVRIIADPALQSDHRCARERIVGAVYLHENSRPGLYAVLSAMDVLMVFQYIMVSLFILVVTLLASGKLLLAEQRDLRIYRVRGMPASRRRSFAIRFLLISFSGCIAGILPRGVSTDSIVGD